MITEPSVAILLTCRLYNVTEQGELRKRRTHIPRFDSEPIEPIDNPSRISAFMDTPKVQ
jgi:hypothetical protein